MTDLIIAIAMQIGKRSINAQHFLFSQSPSNRHAELQVRQQSMQRIIIVLRAHNCDVH